jgi:hypothetical protein
MGSKNIQESQQQGQGITIGNQGNEDITIPQGTKGSHRSKGRDEGKIPNQDRSSAANNAQKDAPRNSE